MTYQLSTRQEAAFAALADPTRRVLLSLLRERPQPVGELARQMPISRPAVSQHLKVLKDARLVTEQREGVRHYFSLDPAGFNELRDYADAMWNDALGSFAAYVNEQTKNVRVRSGKKKEK